MAASPGSMTDGVLNVRSSTQTPFLTRRALADIFDLAPDKVRVFCERVGGGFGGKQEMFVEDILALAALKTGRPVKLELTREEQFIATSTRHPMRVHVKAGADRDGKLTALQLDVLSNTGAYGNHGRLGAVSCLRRVDQRLQLPEQEGRRGRRLYQHGAGRRLPRLWPAADPVRGRGGDRRTGQGRSASALTNFAAATW